MGEEGVFVSAVVVVLLHDRQRAAWVASGLRKHFRSVVTVRSVDEVCCAASRGRIAASVLDLEMVTFDDIKRLKSKFEFPVVCTHRLADNKMWALALRAGAVDCCYDDDVVAICRAVTGAAAAAA